MPMRLMNIFTHQYQTHMSKIKIDCVIGIDPGKSGGIAVWKPGHATSQIKMPADLMDLRKFFTDKMEVCNPIVFIEKVNMRPQDMEGGKAFGIAKMMEDFNTLKNIMTFVGIPFILVPPTKWQNDLNLRAKGLKEEKKDRKKRYQKFAQNIYKELKVSLWSADALCIMSFGRHALLKKQDWILTVLPQQFQSKLFE